MTKILVLVTVILLAILFRTDLLSYLFEFITSLLVLDNTKPDVSIISEVIISIITYAFSFGIVGLVFGLIGCHERNLMKLSYWIISVIVGFLMNHLVRIIESYAFYLLVKVVLTGTLACIISIIVKVIRSENMISDKKEL